MALRITLSVEMPASKEKIQDAWLKGKEHAQVTGESATGSNRAGGVFTAQGDYISGKNTQLVPCTKIVQSWRATQLSDDESDSTLEVKLNDKADQRSLHGPIPIYRMVQFTCREDRLLF